MGKEQGKEQSWALGTVEGSPREIEILGSSGERRIVPLEQAVKLGIPKPEKTQRHVFEGNFASWRLEEAEAYLAGVGLGLEIPPDAESRHDVFTFAINEKLTAHVPALALMRALFKPHSHVLPAVFHPLSLNLISFVNLCESPPAVVVDKRGSFLKMDSFRAQSSVSRERAIQWCQLSVSARAMSWSVFRNALVGRLGMTLPQGQVRLVLHGVRKEGELFVTQVALIQVDVSAEDSLTGRQEQYIFHAAANQGRQRYASVKGLSVSARPDGEYRVSDAEWERLEPKMYREHRNPRYPHRVVLDSIVQKMHIGTSWQNLSDDPKLVNAVKAAFRKWSADGRLGIALEVLTAERCAGKG